MSFRGGLGWISLTVTPSSNSTLTNDQIKLYDDVNIGVAVAVDEGLVVPVVRNADKKSLEEIVVELEALIGKAKQRALSLEEMAGGTFTISNLGVFGIESFWTDHQPSTECDNGSGRGDRETSCGRWPNRSKANCESQLGLRSSST